MTMYTNLEPDFNSTVFERMDAAGFVEFINNRYEFAADNSISRYDVEWGKWSRQMNLVLRRRIESGSDPETVKLKYVIVYWTLISKMLELSKTHKLLHDGRKKRLKKEIAEILTVIHSADQGQDLKLDEVLVNKILK